MGLGGGGGVVCCMGNSFPSILTYPGLALWRGHSTFALQRRQNTGSSSLPVISLHSVGVESDARGYFRRWERSSYLTGQLPPALSWADPSQ